LIILFGPYIRATVNKAIKAIQQRDRAGSASPALFVLWPARPTKPLKTGGDNRAARKP